MYANVCNLVFRKRKNDGIKAGHGQKKSLPTPQKKPQKRDIGEKNALLQGI
jgi:hypothetical protein